MQEAQKTYQIKWWPSPQDYNEAVQNPLANLAAEDLRRSAVVTDALGLPRPMSGAFASVYRLKAKTGESVALRCFLRNVADQEQRYTFVSDFVENDDLPYTVSFRFYDRGIRVNGNWFPCLKMDWVDGDPLDVYIRKNVHNEAAMLDLTAKFVQMCKDLQRAGIAHGDLQHGNILVCDGELRLVDYDGMYVPSMSGLNASELGHPNYQHPDRNAGHFGPYLDNFSAWLIYGSLRALTLDPSLFKTLAAGDDCLLFRRDDLSESGYSFAFHTLETHSHSEIKALARFLRFYLQRDPAEMPALDTKVPEVAILPPVRYKARKAQQKRQEKQHSRSVLSTVLPDWVSSFSASAGSNPAAAVRAQVQAQSPAPPAQQQVIPTFPGMPLELRQPRPRPYKYNKGCGKVQPKWKQLLVLANPLVFLICLGSFMSTMEHCNIVKYGIDVPAQVMSVEYHGGKSHYYHVDYKYDTPDGRTLSGSTKVDTTYGAGLEKDPTHVFKVRVLPNNMTKHIADLPEDPEGPVNQAVHAVVSDVLTSILIWGVIIWSMISIWWRPGKDRWLVQHGKPAPGTVTWLEEVRGSKGARSYFVHYRFRSQKGVVQSRLPINERQFKQYKVNDRVVVLYDQHNPQYNHIYELSYYQATP